MNKIWSFVILACLLVLITINPSLVLPSFLTGSSKALTLSLELFSIYAVWLGIISIVENTRLSYYISKLLSPIIDKLWGKKLKKQAKNYLSLSISASLLGIGGASVPLGIKAIENMDDKSGTVTFPIILTIVFASSGLQFLPTTIMSLMTVSGSTDPARIVLPTLFSGLVTTVSGFLLAFLFEAISKKRRNKK